MKKILLFVSLISAMTSFANATLTGSSKVETGLEIKKFDPFNYKPTMKFVGEVGVKDYGISAGTELVFGNGSGKLAVAKTKDSKVWAKYMFPTYKTLKSEIKVTYQLDHKTEVATKISADVKRVNLALKASYSAEKFVVKNFGFKASLDSKFRITDTTELTGGFGTSIKFKDGAADKDDHTYDIIGNLGFKYTGVEGLTLEASEQTTVTRKKDAADVEYKGKVKVNAGATYKGVKNLTLQSKVEVVFDEFKRNGDGVINYNKWSVKPEASAEYRLMATKQLAFIPKFAMIAEVSNTNTKGNLKLQPSLKMEYKPIKDLTITGNTVVPLDIKLDGSTSYKPTVTTKFTGSVQYNW